MLKSFRVRLIVILAVLGISIGYYWTQGLTLGLDLQGGMHLVLEIDDPDGTMTPEVREDHIDQALHVLRTRIDAFGVQEPLIQKSGSDRIIVELAGLDDPERAKDIINQQAYLEWKLVLSTADFTPSLERLDRAIVATVGVDSLRRMGAATEAAPDPTSLEELLFSSPDDSAAADTTTADEPADDPDTAAAQDPADSAVAESEADFRPFTGLLQVNNPTLQGRDPGSFLVDAAEVEAAMAFIAMPEFRRTMPRGVSLQWGTDSVPMAGRFYRELFVLEEDPFLTGEQLEDASATRDQQDNQPVVLFQLNRRGGRVFEDVTTEHQFDRIAIVLDGAVMSAPTVEDRIGARGRITMGNADFSEAADLALVLRAGALPAQLRIMEERRVGPSLGQDSIDQGQIAGLVGVVLVLAIMIAYYRIAGLLAVLALAIYLTLVIGGLSMLPDATLTLPGIAGLILSIGMAVDANVLIFERIREELERRRAPRTAVDEGFSNAMSAIVDANITTLITGLILFQFGTQSVKGFAVTLCIGIVASFFTALYVTRTLFLVYLQGKRGSDPISI